MLGFSYAKSRAKSKSRAARAALFPRHTPTGEWMIGALMQLSLRDDDVAATKDAVQQDEEFLHIVEATPLVSIDLIVRNEAGDALLGRRLNRPAKDSWFVPGGRILKNERVKDALRRISRRELGIVISEATLTGAFDHLYPDNFLGAPGVTTHYVALGFAAELPNAARLTPDNQHSELKWWNIATLLADALVHENTKAYFRK